VDRKIPGRVEISEEALDRQNPDAAPALAPGATAEHHDLGSRIVGRKGREPAKRKKLCRGG